MGQRELTPRCMPRPAAAYRAWLLTMQPNMQSLTAMAYSFDACCVLPLAQVIFSGLRCRVGIYSGPIDRVTPHTKTGRADYFGQVGLPSQP